VDKEKAVLILDQLVSKNTGEGSYVAGVLIVTSSGNVEISMNTEKSVRTFKVGVRVSYENGVALVSKEIDEVTPVLEELQP
jgi:hypothetical protein